MGAATPQRPPLRTVAVIPARIGSTRLPRKILLAETGLPLFVHSARNVERCAAIERVVVATDSEEVQRAGAAVGVEVLLTSPAHQSGTDRVHEALGLLGERYDVVINVQADEPDVEPHDLAALVAAFGDPGTCAATLSSAVTDEDELVSANVVKVVCDAQGDALYFSRARIPDARHARPGVSADGAVRRHVGVYAFRPDALARFCALPPSRLEALENLEQLRWLEAGERMRVLPATRVPRGIDTRIDYEAFVARAAAALRDPHRIDR
jgi:3-deoxy-manno-octulosonate cytidylyltransferase (CMP-KDO synthetase)